MTHGTIDVQTPMITVLDNPGENSNNMSMVNEEDKGNQASFKSYHSGSDF